MESSTTVSANELPNSVLEDSIADNVAQEKDSVKTCPQIRPSPEGERILRLPFALLRVAQDDRENL